MGLKERKLDVMQKLMSVSKTSLLDKVDNLLDQEMIVGFTVEGEPLTKESYNMRLQVAEKQILSGESTTQEDLEKESENW